jgi:hypothetical protein
VPAPNAAAPDAAAEAARAQPHEVPPPEAAPEVPSAGRAEQPTATRRDSPESARSLDVPHPVHGLYVRGALGIAGVGNNVVGSEESAAGINPEATITGMGMASELSVGGAVSSKWVLGAGLWNSLVFTTDYRQIQGSEIPADLQRPESFTVAGFFGDWHFARELGLHAQGGIGVAMLTSQRYDDDNLSGEESSTVGLGPGATFGVGADFWMSDSWALGAVARLTTAAVIDREQGARYVHGLVAPSLLMSACYNE